MLRRPVKVRDDMVAMVAALAVRGFFLPAANGAYTDGILALETFKYGLSYWPPFYAIAARLFAWIPGVGLEGGGRLVSFIAGILVIIPLMALTKALFGRRASRWSATAWILSPMAMRWSLQPMTDALMVALWTATLAAVALAARSWRPELFAQGEAQTQSPNPRNAFRWMIVASSLGTLATLTRYQGIFLLIPICIVILWRLKTRNSVPSPQSSVLLSLLPWLFVPLWFVREGLAPLINHFNQFGERSSGINLYWLMFEEFAMRLPYFASWGLFGFFMYGLLRVNWSTWRLRWAGWISLALAILILGLQSAFMSFQERYLFPLIPLVCVFAGHGFATWQRRCERRPVTFWIVVAPALAYALVFSSIVALRQCQPFEDLKLAARAVAKFPEAKIGKIYTNETYNPAVDEKIGPPKSMFWTGRKVQYMMQGAWGDLRPGDVVICSSWNSGMPLDQFEAMIDARVRLMKLNVIGRYVSSTLPLLPDLVPGLNQNPQAMAFRYQTQYFETIVVQVKGDPHRKFELPPPPQQTPDAAEQQHRERLKELEDLNKQLEKQKKGQG